MLLLFGHQDFFMNPPICLNTIIKITFTLVITNKMFCKYNFSYEYRLIFNVATQNKIYLV